MIHITYTGWVAVFCFLQLAQLGLFVWVLKTRSKIDIAKPLEDIKKDLIKDAAARNAILIKLFRPDLIIEENQAQKAEIK